MQNATSGQTSDPKTLAASGDINPTRIVIPPKPMMNGCNGATRIFAGMLAKEIVPVNLKRIGKMTNDAHRVGIMISINGWDLSLSIGKTAIIQEDMGPDITNSARVARNDS